MSYAIPFFPPSLPDETLNSRAARYHLVAGNTTHGATLDQLFGSPQAGLDQVVPPGIDILAQRLPGDRLTNLHTILSENTLLPLFQPFIGQMDVQANQQSLLNRLPRRVVGKHGDAYLCNQCVRDDESHLGIAYWHRAHQAPGVSACWKHRTQLLSSCPSCKLPFQRRYRLLDATWGVCPNCSSNLFQAPPVEQCSDHAYRYATFVHDLINANFPPVPPDVLALTYRTQIQLTGFIRGSKTALAAFTESLISALGEDFIRSVDPAYATGKTSFWLRFNYIGGAMDMPVTRHLLLSMHLFGTADRFLHAVRQLLPAAEPTSIQRKAGQIATTDIAARNEHRKRIRHELKLEPDATMERLWKKAYRSTGWLFENDKSWLNAALTQHRPRAASDAPVQSDEDKRQDKHFVTLVDARVRQLFASKEKPQRVTLGRLATSLPIKLETLRRNEVRYPLLNEHLERCKESSWSFSARRVLWAMGEINRLEMSTTIGNLMITSSVSYYAIRKILNFCRWDFVAMATQKINPLDELSKAGVGLIWQGPDSSALNEVGGRSYIALTSRKSNKRVDLLRAPAQNTAASCETVRQPVSMRPLVKRKRAA